MKNKQTWLSTFCGLVVLLFLATAPFSWAQGQSEVVVVPAAKHVVSPPLRQIVPIAPQSETLSAPRDYHVAAGPSAFSITPVQAPDLQGSSPGTGASSNLSTNTGLDILGIGTGFPGYSTQANIAVANGAAGTTQYVQFVNESFAVFNKSTGSLIYGPANGNTLWQALGAPCSSISDLDEIAQYDKLANVWVMMMPLYTNPPYLCIAVSTSSDATGSWNLYAFEIPVNTTLCHCRMAPDYPKLGVWPDAYYIAYDQAWYLTYEGPAACAVNRSAMLNGSAATMQCFLHNGATNGVWLPGDVDGTTPPPSGSPEYFLNLDANFQSLDLWQFHVDWTTPSNSTFTGPTNIPVAAFTEPCGDTSTILFTPQDNCVPQAGTTQMLGAYGDRLMYRLAYRNFGTYQALVANHTVQVGTGSNQTGISWYELQNTGSGFGLYQQGTYAPDSNYRWMGSIAMDKAGNIALGYNVSSSSMSPSIRYTGHLSTDALGTMESEIDVLSAAGVATTSQTNSVRWGDYSGMAIDPTDDCTFWYTNQYQPANGKNHWSTRIASFNFPSCTNTPPNFTLSVTEVGQGTVTSTDGQINCTNGSGTCSAVYASGSSVTLNATAGGGWSFSRWSGACTGGNPCNLVMNSNLSVTATCTSTSWAVVHKASNYGNPITSLTIPGTGTGNLIAVALMFNGKTSVASISDNAGNTYLSAGARAVIGILSTEIWYAVNSKAGATTVTPTFVGSPTHVEITEWEVSGLSTAVPDATNTASGSVTLNNTPGPAVSTSRVGDFVVSALFANSTNFTRISTGNAFTDDFTTDGNGWAHITSNSAAAGTQQASWYTASPVGVYCASTVAFLSAN